MDGNKSGFWRTMGIVIGVMALMAVVAYLFNRTSTGDTADTATDLAITLAPFLAIATAIERFWELVFNQYEAFAGQLGKVIGGKQ